MPTDDGTQCVQTAMYMQSNCLSIFAVLAQSLLLNARTNSYVKQLKQVETSCPSQNYVANYFFKQLSTV